MACVFKLISKCQNGIDSEMRNVRLCILKIHDPSMSVHILMFMNVSNTMGCVKPMASATDYHLTSGPI